MGREEGRTTKGVMTKILGYRVWRCDRATVKIKAKWPGLGCLPHSDPSSRKLWGEPLPLQIPLLETGLRHEKRKR